MGGGEVTWESCFFSSSYRIGPVEVESALAEHPAVLEAAVVSSPDPIRGEVTSPAKSTASWFCPLSTQQSKLEGPDAPISDPIQIPESLKGHQQTDNSFFLAKHGPHVLDIQMLLSGIL